MATYSIEEWLRGKVDYEFPDEAIKAILYDRGVEAGSEMSDVSVRDRELCYADLLMYAAGSSTSTTGEYMSDGGWQHQKPNKNVVNRSYLRDLANKIYAKWDDDKADAAGGITLQNLY